jgi:hypothetical protein
MELDTVLNFISRCCQLMLKDIHSLEYMAPAPTHVLVITYVLRLPKFIIYHTSLALSK